MLFTIASLSPKSKIPKVMVNRIKTANFLPLYNTFFNYYAWVAVSGLFKELTIQWDRQQLGTREKTKRKV